MYFTRVCVPPKTETQRESHILQAFVRLLKKHSVNHVFCGVLSAVTQWNRAWIMYFAFFERFEAVQQSVNHVFCRVLSASRQWNRAWITYFAGFWTLRSNEAERESRILHGFERFQALKHNVNHVFCEVLRASKHWNMAWITYFAGF